MSVYSSKILELATNIHHINKTIDQNDFNYANSTKISKICGSEIKIEIIYDPKEDLILAFSIDPKACALGQASAAILSQAVIGATGEEIIKARNELRKMLKENGPMPIGRFWELKYLEPISDYPSRHASTMLAWEACVAAIENVRDRQI